MTFDTKTKELIAIGSSIAANCQPCLEYHLKIAKDSGATEDEIKNAIEIARFVKSKSAIAMDEFAREIISDSKKLSEESGQEKSSKSSNLCCG
ncbi:MAG: carboxymuconolactone decarboxylase family protein [Candidatus Methanoperedens sp.]|nr:carboxymuconolactone decarboxylase family protein [Candidatus Methanoperedens sp.]